MPKELALFEGEWGFSILAEYSKIEWYRFRKKEKERNWSDEGVFFKKK